MTVPTAPRDGRRGRANLSNVLGAASILFVVPVAALVTYWGYSAGYYPYSLVPLAFAGVLAVVFAVLLVVLPWLDQRTWRH